MKELYEALEQLVWLGQLGLSLAMPLLLCLALCWWLTTARGVGGWVYVPGFLLGLGGGAASFKSFARRMLRRAEKEQKDAPVSFDRH